MEVRVVRETFAKLLYGTRHSAQRAALLGTIATVVGEGLPVLFWSLADDKLVFY